MIQPKMSTNEIELVYYKNMDIPFLHFGSFKLKWSLISHNR